MSFSSTNKKRKNVWENNERHYCSICNSWMGSDKQSILIHERGKKHVENVEFQLNQRRINKAKDEQRQKQVASTLKMIESVAQQSYQMHDVGQGHFAPPPQPLSSISMGSSYQPRTANVFQNPPVTTSSMPLFGTSIHQNLPNASSPIPRSNQTAVVTQEETQDQIRRKKGVASENKNTTKESKKADLDAWCARKLKREEERDQCAKKEDVDKEGSVSTSKQNGSKTSRGRKLREEEGYYAIGAKTYLEGDVFAPIVEEGMQAEVWMGPIDREEDMRDASMSRHWKVGLIVRIHKKKRSDDSSSGMLTKSSKPAADDQDSKNSIRYLFDFAYLKNENDSDETLEKNVDPIRTRLLVGSGSPVPDSIDEARLSLLGGEEIISFESQQAKPNDAADSDPIGAFQEQIDENTGFTKFATISIRKVTTAHEERQERQRAKKERNDVIQRQLELQNEVRKRQMEEAKHTNGDDSALGAYDVWTDGKNGYKGIDINREGAEEDTENAKSLAEGKGNVLFKKKKAMDLQDNVGDIRAKFRKVRKKNFRHKTSTTHDDD